MRWGVVLGGGGTLGISWTSGLLAGLAASAAFDARAAHSVVATSAGSVVAGRLCSGATAEDLLDRERRASKPRSGGGLRDRPTDRQALAEIFRMWAATSPMTDAVARAIGTLAVRAAPFGEQEWLDATRRSVGDPSWTMPGLRIAVVDCATGARRIIGPADDVEPVRAVAASTAVPGLFPPVTIDGALTMDGGVRSTTHADAIEDVEHAVVIAPQLGMLERFAHEALERETAVLRARGITVTSIVPGERYRALATNAMDASLRAEAAEAGFGDAAAAASPVRETLG